MDERKAIANGVAPFARVAIKGTLVRQPQLVELPKARTSFCKFDVKVGTEVIRDLEAHGEVAKELNATLANTLLLLNGTLSTVTWKTEDQVEHYKLKIEADRVRPYKRLAVKP